ncbi:hypothetical protein FB451DRAFT_1172966 [Mycena latifolia]|nr:hypothetical protein FB451DRAFT_1172966 [Mycena latifolia]
MTESPQSLELWRLYACQSYSKHRRKLTDVDLDLTPIDGQGLERGECLWVPHELKKNGEILNGPHRQSEAGGTELRDGVPSVAVAGEVLQLKPCERRKREAIEEPHPEIGKDFKRVEAWHSVGGRCGHGLQRRLHHAESLLLRRLSEDGQAIGKSLARQLETVPGSVTLLKDRRGARFEAAVQTRMCETSDVLVSMGKEIGLSELVHSDDYRVRRARNAPCEDNPGKSRLRGSQHQNRFDRFSKIR